MKLILKKDFNDEQKKLAKDLLDQGKYEAEIFEWCDVEVYGLIEKEDGETSILFEFAYADPEGTGNKTIFCVY